MRNILVILALFVCTSICLGLGEHPRRQIKIEGATNPDGSDIAGNGDPDSNFANYGKAPYDGWYEPVGNRLIISNPEAEVGDASGACIGYDILTTKSKKFELMTDNEVIVYGGKFGCGFSPGNIAGACAFGIYRVNVSSNTVIITGGTDIRSVYGGYALKGTVSSNTVTISNSVTIGKDVLGAWIGKDGLANSNTVTITGGRVGGDVLGGYVYNDGTATGNKVNLTDVGCYAGCLWSAD